MRPVFRYAVFIPGSTMLAAANRHTGLHILLTAQGNMETGNLLPRVAYCHCVPGYCPCTVSKVVPVYSPCTHASSQLALPMVMYLTKEGRPFLMSMSMMWPFM